MLSMIVFQNGFYLLSSTDEKAAQDAIELLTTNATNLMSVVEGVLYTADRAIIQVPQSELERFIHKGMFDSISLHVS